MLEIFGVHGLVLALVALIVIGPKDMPKAMRLLGYWVGRARGVARQFQAGFDNMVREAELAEMEKKWAEENARILAEHPATTVDEPGVAKGDAAVATSEGDGPDLFSPPAMVEKPIVRPAAAGPAGESKAAS